MARLAAWPLAARAQTSKAGYPTKPVRIIVPVATGYCRARTFPIAALRTPSQTRFFLHMRLRWGNGTSIGQQKGGWSLLYRPDQRKGAGSRSEGGSAYFAPNRWPASISKWRLVVPLSPAEGDSS